jgi:D-alanine-D-alanine ligase
MKVLIVHSLPPSTTSEDRRVWEFDLADAVRGIAEVLPSAIVAGIRGEAQELMAVLSEHQPDVVFNACEAPLGRPELEPHFAALLEWVGVRFTGARSQTLALCRRKDQVKAVLAVAGVPVPRSDVFPCIVKPADEDGSYGIYVDSICEDETAVARVRSRLTCRTIVEEFLPGREFVVSLWGDKKPDYSSIGETHFEGGLRLNTYSAKWDIDSFDYANAPLFYDKEIAPELRNQLVSVSQGAWRAVEAHGYLRLDLRLGLDGIPRVIDVNPNPELGAGVGINRAVIEAGWTWEQFVKQQIAWA